MTLNSNIAVHLSAYASDGRRTIGERTESPPDTIPHPIAKRQEGTPPCGSSVWATQRAGKTGGPGPGRRGEFAVLLEDEPYEGQHVVERIFSGGRVDAEFVHGALDRRG